MTELTHELGAGRPPVPEPHAGVACCTVADLPSGPVTCGLPAGHRGPRAWAALMGPTGSRVPGRSGAVCTQAARATAARSAGGRRVGIHDLCAKPSRPVTASRGRGPSLCDAVPR